MADVEDEEYKRLQELKNEVDLIRRRREFQKANSDALDSVHVGDIKVDQKENSRTAPTELSGKQCSGDLASLNQISGDTHLTAIEKQKKSKNGKSLEVSLQEAKDCSPTAEKTKQTLREMDDDLKTLEREIELLRRPKFPGDIRNRFCDSDNFNLRANSVDIKKKEPTADFVSNEPDEKYVTSETAADMVKKKSFEEKDEILLEVEAALGKKYAEPADKSVGEAYRCRFCGLTYNYMTTLRAHERVHDVEEPYVCNRCGLSYRYYSELQVHSQEHRGERGFKCECGRVFSKYFDLLNHTHPDEEALCTASGALDIRGPVVGVLPDFEILSAKAPPFVTKDIPNSRKSYYCQFCCKSYATSNELKYHLYGHRGERQFTVGTSRYLMNRL